nr:unnamed protein product [Callosobruchus analis]
MEVLCETAIASVALSQPHYTELRKYSKQGTNETDGFDDVVGFSSSVEGEGSPSQDKQNVQGKNRYKWSAIPPNQNLNIRTKKHNLVKVLPGLKGPQSVVITLIHYKYGAFYSRKRWKMKLSYKEIRELTKEEFRAFIAILYYSAVFKSNDEDLEEMFSTDGTGRDIFRYILFLKRVQLLLTCLRELRLNIGRVLNKQLPIEESRSIQNQKRRRCGICERKNDKKTKISCNKCERLCVATAERIYAKTVSKYL